MPPGYSQLPPTNMGKWVHQPGDNQYGSQAQNERHSMPVQMSAPASDGGGGGGGYSGWSPTPRPFKPDVSLDPIAADEPVPPAGFPPLPDKLDLPVASSWAGGATGGGMRPSYGGANAPGMSGGGGGGSAPPAYEGSHQHYNHYTPGSFGQSASHGYYKATTPAAPNSDVYSGGGGGAPGMAGGGAPSDAERQLMRMGKEPKLNPKADQQASPEAPAPVVINQATSQDLSLPEDDFSYDRQQRANSAGRRIKRSVGRTLLRPINSVGSYAGISF